MRNVAHFFFSYNGIFGIEEVILQNNLAEYTRKNTEYQKRT